MTTFQLSFPPTLTMCYEAYCFLLEKLSSPGLKDKGPNENWQLPSHQFHSTPLLRHWCMSPMAKSLQHLVSRPLTLNIHSTKVMLNYWIFSSDLQKLSVASVQLLMLKMLKLPLRSWVSISTFNPIANLFGFTFKNLSTSYHFHFCDLCEKQHSFIWVFGIASDDTPCFYPWLLHYN